MSKPVKLKVNDRVRIFWFGTHYKGTVTQLREELGVDVQLDHDVFLPRCQWKTVEAKKRAPWYIMEKLPATDTIKAPQKPVKIEEKPIKKITSVTDLFDENSKTELEKTFETQKKFSRGKLKK